MDSGGGGSGPGTKKSLQEMSREELLQKCKTLLAIAHKAKVAKDGKFAWWSACFWFSYFTFFFELLLFLMTGYLLLLFLTVQVFCFSEMLPLNYGVLHCGQFNHMWVGKVSYLVETDAKLLEWEISLHVSLAVLLFSASFKLRRYLWD